MNAPEEGWPKRRNNDESDDEELCNCSCSCQEKIIAYLKKAWNKPINPLTLRIRDEKTQIKFLKFSRAIALRNLKYVNILLVLSLIIQFLFLLDNLKEKGAILLYFVDIVIVGLLVQCLGKKYHRLIDHGPTLVILFRSICVGILHSSYRYDIGITIGGEIERS